MKDEFSEEPEAESQADHELAPRTPWEWFRQKGYHWADLEGGVLEDGVRGGFV